MRRLEGTNYAVGKALKSDPLPKEVQAAKILEENGHKVFFTPRNMTKGMKSYDAIIDGRIGEFKKLESFKQIRNRLNEADGRQRAAIVCLEPPTENYTVGAAIKEVKNWFKSSQHQIKYVDTVLLIWNGLITTIKK